MGEILALAGLGMFSTCVILTKVATGRLELHVGFLIAVSVNVLFSALLLACQLLLLQDAPQWNNRGFLLFLVAGFFSTYLGRYLFYDSVAKLGPTKASAFQTSNPLFTVIIAWIFWTRTLPPTTSRL